VGYGPGEERLAHQPDEHLPVSDLEAAVTGYRRLIAELMRPKAAPKPREGRRPQRRGRARRRAGGRH